MHIPQLEQLMTRPWVLFDRAEVEGGNVVPIAVQIRKIEMDLGASDSSVVAVRSYDSTDEAAIELFITSVLEPIPPDASKVLSLMEDGEFARFRQPPAPLSRAG